MKWLDLIASLPTLNQGGVGNPEINDLSFDSRSVSPGALFIAVAGFKEDGTHYIKQAISKGAVAVVSEKELPDISVPFATVSNARKVISLLAMALWEIDFSTIKLVGITGTNGKTTTVGLYQNLFSQLYGKREAWMFSTVVYEIDGKAHEAPKTTPEASDLLRFIGNAKNNPKSICMEVSSHALTLRRVEGFLYDLAVWTNLTQDHLDFHETMELYYQAKKELFLHNLKETGIAIINSDDTWGNRLHDELTNVKTMTYGYNSSATVRAIAAQCSWAGIDLTFAYQDREHQMHSSLTGEFNVYNTLALIAGALALGISIEEISQSLSNMSTVPGRMEQVSVQTDFSVVVDYAHTPDALENILSTSRKLTQGRLICVFGCGGDRDRLKRPLMAKAVVNHCDEAIITNDNPRTESPRRIVDDILEGVPLDFPHLIIKDRREAIKKALSMGKKDDCIVIAGKGHETYQEVNGVRSHFDDRECVKEVCVELGLVS